MLSTAINQSLFVRPETTRDALGNLHAYRIALTFARLSVAETLALLKLNQIKITLNAPIPLFNALSFGILGCRLLFNIAHAFNHLLLSSSFERFFDLQILNDIIWASANLFTNYPQILGLSNPVVNAILLGCLTFDLALSAHLYSQLDSNDIENKAKLEQFIAAGLVIFLAFSLIASSALPFFLPLGAALCVFGTSLYLTADKRAEYIKAPAAEKDTAYEVYTTAIIKNTVYPLLFMVAAASLGWPVAIVLACTVGAFEMYHQPENTLPHTP